MKNPGLFQILAAVGTCGAMSCLLSLRSAFQTSQQGRNPSIIPEQRELFQLQIDRVLSA